MIRPCYRSRLLKSVSASRGPHERITPPDRIQWLVRMPGCLLVGTLAGWRFVWIGAKSAGRSAWGIPCGGPPGRGHLQCMRCWRIFRRRAGLAARGRWDGQGREVLTFLPGETVGSARPWSGGCTPRTPWWRSPAGCAAFIGRSLTSSVAWCGLADGRAVAPGLIVGHNDAAPYNAV